MATTIQVEYWKNQEIKRHNQAAENQAAKELAETARHNYRTEGQTDVSQHEISRHNRAQESIGFGQLAETTRHNTVQEGNEAQRNQESIRHNMMMESNDAQRNAETVRHNQMTESLSSEQLAQLISEQDRRYALDSDGTVKFNIAGQTYSVPASKAEEILRDAKDDTTKFTKKGYQWLLDTTEDAALKGKAKSEKVANKIKEFGHAIVHGRSVEIGGN